MVSSAVSRWTAAVLATLLAPVAGAQELPLEVDGFDDGGAFVTGASRRRQTLAEAPAQVTVINAQEIRRFGWRTITDVLANVRGFYVTDDRNYSYVGVRGFARPGDYNSRILVLVNGHAMNDVTYFATLLGEEFLIDLDLVERIEVIRGPVSALYGTNALLAVVNVVTRTGPDVRQLDGAGVSASAEVDSLQRGKAALRFDQLLGPWRVALSVSGYGARGQRYELSELDLPGPTARDSDRGRALNVFGTVQRGPLTIQGGFNTRHKKVPTASYQALPDAGEETTDGRGFLEGQLELELSPEIALHSRLFFDQTRYRGTYPYAEEDGGMLYDSGSGLAIGAESIVQVTPSDWAQLALGASAQRSFDILQTADQPSMGSFVEDRRAYWSAAAFGDLQLQYGDLLVLSGGVRLDYYETFGHQLSPRATLVITPGDGLAIKLIHGQAFRAPNVYELYYSDIFSAPQPELTPEYLTHYELSVEKSMLRGQAEVSLALFRYEIEGLIGPVEDASTELQHFENLEDVVARGFELGLSGRLPWLGMQASADYTLALTRGEEPNRRLTNSPEHLLKARLLLPLFDDRAGLAVAGRFVSARVSANTHRTTAGAAFVLDATFTYNDLVPGLDLGVGLWNLLDTAWFAPASVEHDIRLIPQDRRALWLKVAYTF